MIRATRFGVVRRCYEAVASLVFMGGWASKAAYALGFQGAVETSQLEVVVDDPTPLPRPLKMAFASDFHAGPMTDIRVFREVFRRIQEFSPDVVFLGGDFVGLHSRHIETFKSEVRSVVAPLGVFAIIGNHDLWKGEAVIRRALEGVGVIVLKNAAVRLPGPFEGVVVGGLDDPYVGNPDPDKTFAGQEGIRVALMHSPEGIHLMKNHAAAVVFSGHTHGGQVCLPGGQALLVPPRCWRWKKGHFAVAGIPGGLVVSRGVGCSTLPIRLACSSEVHLCTLRSTQAIS